MDKTQVWQTHPLVRRDLNDILAIEKLSSETPWYPVGYETLMRNAGSVETIGIVVRDRSVGKDDWGQCVGVCLTRRIGSGLHILRLCVDPDWRRKGVGRVLYQAVEDRAMSNPAKYKSLVCNVHERWLDNIWPFFKRVDMRIMQLTNGYRIYRFESEQVAVNNAD